MSRTRMSSREFRRSRSQSPLSRVREFARDLPYEEGPTPGAYTAAPPPPYTSSPFDLILPYIRFIRQCLKSSKVNQKYLCLRRLIVSQFSGGAKGTFRPELSPPKGRSERTLFRMFYRDLQVLESQATCKSFTRLASIAGSSFLTNMADSTSVFLSCGPRLYSWKTSSIPSL